LLLPEEVKGRKLTDLTEGKRIDDAKLGNVDCFRVQGKYTANPITLWIDKTTFLVRRIDTENKFEDFRTEVSTTYNPVIGGAITDKMLEFDPPQSK
jgi:outer membrane lipoprotein-sorting protein